MHALATTHPIINSDHAPIILNLVPLHRSGTSFNYEAFWEDSKECRDIVANAWNSEVDAEDTWGRVIAKMKTCKSSLQSWHKEKFKNVATQVKSVKNRRKNYFEPGLGRGAMVKG